MTWNYRVIKHITKLETYFVIHEVYYDQNGKIINWTKEAMEPFGETKEELKKDLEHMIKAFKHPILEYKELESQNE